MVRRINGRPLVAVRCSRRCRRSWPPLPAVAQPPAWSRASCIDDKGQPVDGAKVTIEMNGGTGRKFETKTDKKGEFIQIGLPSGRTRSTAEKDKLGSAPATVDVRVNSTQDANLTLGIGERGGRARRPRPRTPS